MFLTSRVHLVDPGLTMFHTIDRERQAMATALCVKAAREVVDLWERSEVKGLLRADQEVTLLLRAGETQGYSPGAFASGQPRHHLCHGTGKPYIGRAVAYKKARHRDEDRRQIGYGSPSEQLDGATLLLVSLQVPCATRWWDASRSVGNRRRACLFRRSRLGTLTQKQLYVTEALVRTWTNDGLLSLLYGLGIHNAECLRRNERILLQQSRMKPKDDAQPQAIATTTKSVPREQEQPSGPTIQRGGSSGSTRPAGAGSSSAMTPSAQHERRRDGHLGTLHDAAETGQDHYGSEA